MERASQQNLPDLDTRLLSNFVYEINIARRHMSTYPNGHPMIAKSTDKVLGLLDRLFEFRPAIGFGVARDALMFEGEWLDRKNPVYRDFAAFLFSRGIAAIHFMRHADCDELIRFNQLLRSERAEIQQYGGYPALLETQQISHVKVIPVDYRNFTTVDEERIGQDDYDQEREPLWENFLLGMMEGVLDPAGSRLYMPADFDPRLVAGILNRKSEGQGMSGKENYEAVITSFISQTRATGSTNTRGRPQGPSNEELGTLITELNPELRRQFLNSTFRTLDARQGSAEVVLQAFPKELIIDSLNQINQQQIQVSSSILNLLGKLSKHQNDTRRSSTIQGKTTLDSTDANERMRLIFREEDNRIFIPEAYQNALDTIVSSEQVTLLKDEEMESLRATLYSQSVERQTCAIAFELMSTADSELESTLQHNLVDLARFFLETGDFTALNDLHQRWTDYLNRDEVATFFLAEEVLATLHSREFVVETLDALERFGPDKQEEVRDYILAVGAPFADELINRLSQTESMTIRRYYMGCLKDMGSNAHEAILEGLQDQRWYLVRNLVIVLAQQQIPALIKKLYPLLDYPHPRVHQEILKLMFIYNRPRAERQLLEELKTPDIPTQLYAAQLADRSNEKSTQRQLLTILRDAPFNDEGMELKVQILKVLAKIGDAGVVSLLEGLINSGNLLHPKLFRKLKFETIKTLSRYPAKAAAPLLKTLAKSNNSETASLAVEQLRQLHRDMP
ncbi:MAG: hypothetical protein L3J63_10310 [Geopsychrobacter sp.]|nr:hypothetical protein [Geopsychrobacter sp.]